MLDYTESKQIQLVRHTGPAQKRKKNIVNLIKPAKHFPCWQIMKYQHNLVWTVFVFLVFKLFIFPLWENTSCTSYLIPKTVHLYSFPNASHKKSSFTALFQMLFSYFCHKLKEKKRHLWRIEVWKLSAFSPAVNLTAVLSLLGHRALADRIFTLMKIPLKRVH